jgi:hypothetical protein
MSELFAAIVRHRNEPGYIDLLQALRLEIDRELAGIYSQLPHTSDSGNRRDVGMRLNRFFPTTKVDNGKDQG